MHTAAPSRSRIEAEEAAPCRAPQHRGGGRPRHVAGPERHPAGPRGSRAGPVGSAGSTCFARQQTSPARRGEDASKPRHSRPWPRARDSPSARGRSFQKQTRAPRGAAQAVASRPRRQKRKKHRACAHLTGQPRAAHKTTTREKASGKSPPQGGAQCVAQAPRVPRRDPTLLARDTGAGWCRVPARGRRAMPHRAGTSPSGFGPTGGVASSREKITEADNKWWSRSGLVAWCAASRRCSVTSSSPEPGGR